MSRWGGEEFVILLPNTSSSGALVISEKIRKSIEESEYILQENKKLNYTISIGVAEVNNMEDENIAASI